MPRLKNLNSAVGWGAIFVLYRRIFPCCIFFGPCFTVVAGRNVHLIPFALFFEQMQFRNI